MNGESRRDETTWELLRRWRKEEGWKQRDEKEAIKEQIEAK